MEDLKRNLIYIFKYSDTHLYEFGLAVLMLLINPFHLLAVRQCSTLNDGSLLLLMIGSTVSGLCFGYGVLSRRLEIRYQMARVYWVYTIYTLVTLAPCGLTNESGLVISFVSQFASSLLLLWRLGTERQHRRKHQEIEDQ